MNFTELSLNSNLLSGIADAGYETCTPVQEKVLSGAIQGTDLYVQSQTGTGKTAAYLITIFQQLLSADNLKGKKALIMVPTRELAVQVEEEANSSPLLRLKMCKFLWRRWIRPSETETCKRS